MLIFDIDFFKQYNDCYGHQAGDETIRKVAQIAQTAIKRPGDLVSRYGGEEFVIILPDTKKAQSSLLRNSLKQWRDWALSMSAQRWPKLSQHL